MNFLFAIALACIPLDAVEIINKTETWTDRDQKALESVYENNRCFYRFGDDSPCLKKFFKFNTGSYGVICGKKDAGPQ